MKIETVKLNERYGCFKRHDCPLDVYLPDWPLDDKRPRPAVLIFPGGGYRFVSGGEGDPVALRFACEGYNAYVLRYSTRDTSEAQYPVQALQALAAIDWIKSNAAAHRSDPERVFCMGFSAGGHLCGMTGFLGRDKGLLAALKPKNDLSLRGLCFCYAVVTDDDGSHKQSFINLTGGDKATSAKLSLEKLVGPDAPPAFIWHTADDNVVPACNPLLLASAYARHKRPFELHIFKSGEHGLSLGKDAVLRAGQAATLDPSIPKWFGDALDFFNGL